MTTTTTHTQDQQPAAPDQPTRIFAQWGLPHTVTPRFGARLIQEHHRLHFLSDRASLIGEWVEEVIDRLDAIQTWNFCRAYFAIPLQNQRRDDARMP
ncbi:type IV toxin-antitoxin system YeeU family antitoxin [Aeromonas veronii]|uniref:type IV toxin-antitoxin system YeeU family antitoxin n=1 Tax=Aeromonas veronii TaxID=654 RepID=UPI003EC82780